MMSDSEESGSGYRKIHLIFTISAWILHATPYFFIILFSTAFYDRSRMTGRYLILFCKKPFYVLTHTCPFRRLTPPPSPTSGDGFQFVFFLLCTHLTVNIFMKKLRILFSLVSASPEYGGKCRALRGDRGMLAYTGQNRFLLVLLTLIICFFVSAHTCPFRQPDG